MKSSTYLSLGLLSGVTLWMLSGAIASTPEPGISASDRKKTIQPMKVRVLAVEAKPITREIVVQGELEPIRQVELRAQTASRVVGLPARKGQQLEANTPVIELAAEDRHAQFKRAAANVASQKLEVDGARKLQKQGLQSQNRLKVAEAALASAQAELQKARLELDYLRIEAPFDGVLESRYVELGSHLEKGDKVALMLDESVLKAVGRVSQQSAGSLKTGQEIKVRLLDGREARGYVTYISRLGDTETHSFRVEAEVPNPDGMLTAGVSAELRIAIGEEAAHFFSPAVLSLSDTGTVGVKSVDENGRVRFHPIELVRSEAEGIWVSGLPERLEVITQGQGFVNAGEVVVPVSQPKG